MDQIQFGGLPVISVMQGAVIAAGAGNPPMSGLPQATVQFQLPEGWRGIFVGGGATVRWQNYRPGQNDRNDVNRAHI